MDIKISKSRLTSLAKKYKRMSENLKEIADNIQRNSNDLDWKIPNKTQIENRLKDVMKNMNELEEFSYKTYKYIDDVLNSMQEVDNSVAKKLEAITKATSVISSVYQKLVDIGQKLINSDNRVQEMQTTSSCDPIDLATGNFYLKLDDIEIEGFLPIKFTRYYSSKNEHSGDLGSKWIHNFEMSLIDDGENVLVKYQDGHTVNFELEHNFYISPSDNLDSLERFSGGYKLITPDKYKYVFNKNGRLISILNNVNRKTNIEYNKKNNIKSVSNLCGTLHFSYEDDKLKNIYDDTGRKIEFYYENENLISFKNVLGGVYKYKYDDKSRIISILDPYDNVTVENTFDNDDRAVYQLLGDGGTNKVEYKDKEKINILTERNGEDIKYFYDELFRIFKRVYPDGEEEYTFDKTGKLNLFTDKNKNKFVYEHDKNGNLLKEINPLKEEFNYTYDNLGRRTSLVKPDGGTSFYSYDDYGNMEKFKDSLKREYKFSYNNLNLPTEITLPDKSVYTGEYDYKGNLISVTDSLNNKTIYEYDEINRMKSIILPKGNKSTYEYIENNSFSKLTKSDKSTLKSIYDSRGLLIEDIDEEGNSTKYKYNSLEKMVEKKDSLGNITKFDYDKMWNLCKITNPNGGIEQYIYNKNNYLEKIINAEGYEVNYNYDSIGNIVKITDAKGNITSYKYDVLKRIISIKEANGAVTKFDYDYNGNITKLSDAQNNITCYTYDTEGQLLCVKDANGGEIKYTYNKLGYVETETDLRGGVKKYTYNEVEKIIKLIMPDGNFQEFEYDSNGNLIKVKNSTETILYYEYNNLDQLITIRRPGDETVRIKYTKTGKVSQIIDEDGNYTKYTYDSLNRLIKVMDANGNKTNYVYDAVDNLIEIHKFNMISKSTIDSMSGTGKDNYSTNVKEIIEKFEYDRLGKVIKEIMPDNNVIVYTYDENGNMNSQTDYEGLITKYEYDSVNNLSDINYSDNRNVNYTYDLMRRVIGMSDWSGSNKYELDKLGRIIKVTDHKNNVMKYTWSKAGDKNSITYADGNTVNYQYDIMGKIKNVVDEKGLKTSYSYDFNGNLTEKHFPNNYSTKYIYDNELRLKELANYDNNNNRIDMVLYEYDKTSNRTKNKTLFGETKYKYDKLNQLVECKNNENVKKYFYDSLGNRIRHEIWDGENLKEFSDYEYDDMYKLKNVKGIGIRYPGTEKLFKTLELDYDKRGNISNVKADNNTISKYLFDSSNKLQEVIIKDNVVSKFNYNGFGKRISTEYNLENSDFTNKIDYILDMTRLYDNVAMLEKGNMSQKFIYGVGIVNSKVTDDKSTENLFYMTDDLGSVMRLSNDDGMSKNKFLYDEFGKLKNNSEWNMDNNLYSYTGYQLDSQTGLMYAQARYYIPELGRFMSEDTYKGDLKYPGTLNRYSYCINNPVVFVDPSGHFVFATMGIGAAIGGTISGVTNAVGQIQSGEEFSWGELGVNVAGGAASGALAGTGVGIVGAIAGNAAISTATYTGTQLVNNDNIDAGEMGMNALGGGICGGIGGGGAFNEFAPKGFLSRHILGKNSFTAAKTAANQLTKQVTSGVQKEFYKSIQKEVYKNIAKKVSVGFLRSTISSFIYVKHDKITNLF